MGQTSIRTNHSSVNHLVTLRVIMEESRLKGERICCFVDFRKAFDIVPRSECWKVMIEIGLPLQYRVAIVAIIVRRKLGDNGKCVGFLEVLLKQRSSLS